MTQEREGKKCDPEYRVGARARQNTTVGRKKGFFIASSGFFFASGRMLNFGALHARIVFSALANIFSFGK